MRAVSIAAVVLLLGAAAVPVTQRSDPPLGYTGGGGEASCVACHGGNEVNDFGGRLDLDGLPDRYTPGEKYILTVTLLAEETSIAGFQLAARLANGNQAGTLEAVDTRVVVRDSARISYAHHTESGSAPATSDRAVWSLAWTAPSAGGQVDVSVSANSGNGDNSPLGDLVYFASWTSRSADLASGLSFRD